jgi:hypothetical protein
MMTEYISEESMPGVFDGRFAMLDVARETSPMRGRRGFSDRRYERAEDHDWYPLRRKATLRGSRFSRNAPSPPCAGKRRRVRRMDLPLKFSSLISYRTPSPSSSRLPSREIHSFPYRMRSSPASIGTSGKVRRSMPNLSSTVAPGNSLERAPRRILIMSPSFGTQL